MSSVWHASPLGNDCSAYWAFYGYAWFRIRSDCNRVAFRGRIYERRKTREEMTAACIESVDVPHAWALAHRVVERQAVNEIPWEVRRSCR